MRARTPRFLAVLPYPALALILLTSGVVFAQEDEEAERTRDFLEMEHALSMELVTPHTCWAKPYAEGAVKALFISPWDQGSTTAREIIELMQRFDLNASAIYQGPGARLIGDKRTEWYGGDPEAGTKRAVRLLEAASGVVFINQVKVESLPQPARDKLLEKVLAGTGLVLVGATEPPFKDAAPLPTAPNGLTKASCFTVGKGRVVLLPCREKLSYDSGWETRLDYQMQEQGRALLWAANREPKAALGIIVANAGTGTTADRATVTWAAMPPSSEIRVSLTRDDGVKQALTTTNTQGDGSAEVALPDLRAGDYHVDAIAFTGSSVVNWSTTPFCVSADRAVEAITMEKDWAETGEQLAGTVVLSGALHPNDRLQVRLVDKNARILEQQETRASSRSVPFKFAVEAWMPMLPHVEAVLVDGEHEISANHVFVHVVQRHRDQFHFVSWGSPSGDLAPYGMQSLADNGVTAVLQGGEPPLSMAASDLAFIPYATGFRSSSHTTTAMLDPATGLLKPNCVYNEAASQKAVQTAVKGCRRAREHGVFVYSLGDENAVRGSCLGADCLVAYRRYLESLYGDIAALNKEWDIAYPSFEAIQLLSEGALPATDAPLWFKEYYEERTRLHRADDEAAKGAVERQIALGDTNDEMRALQAGNYARWYDRQAFQNETYMVWCKRYREAFRELDPQAWTGFEGTDSFTIRRHTTRSRQGGDLDQFVRGLDYFGPYVGPANEVVRSIAKPGFPMGNWIGYEPSAETLLRLYWGQVTDNMNTIQWWRWDNLDGYHGYLMPTLAPFPAVKELLQDTQIVRDGLGSLLMHCSMYDNGLAMLYSLPSTYIAHFDGNPSYGDYKRDHDTWHKLLHNAGLQFRYVTDRLLREDKLDAQRYKALILPLAFAMTPSEADAIRRFVQNGGTVIADLRPGLYDGHCKPLEQGLLDDVFGIKRTAKRDAIETDRVNVDGELGGRKLKMKWGNWYGHDVHPQMRVDPTVELTSGKSFGQAFQIHYTAALKSPLCIVNEFGKGRAILLNFSVFNAPAEKLVTELLAAADVVPAIRVAKADPRKSIEITRWKNGDSELLALLGDYQGEANVSLPREYEVYNVKDHTSIGEVAAFATALRPNRAAFFALHPKGTMASALEVKTAPAKRGSDAVVTVRLPKTNRASALVVRAKTPAGQAAGWFDKTYIIGKDKEIIRLPFAHNDPTGDWTLSVTDLMTGRATDTILRVR